jgi:hypothetical protein
MESIELLECIGVSAFGFFNSFGFIKTRRGGSSDGCLGWRGCECCNDFTLSNFDARELLPVVSDCND